MEFVYRCPFCTHEHRGTAADIGRAARCKQCEYQFKIAQPAERDMIFEAPRASFNMKTVWMWGLAVGFVGMTAGFLFAYYESYHGWEREHRGEIVSLSEEAEQALTRGEERQALEHFQQIGQLATGHEMVSEDLRTILERSRSQQEVLRKKITPVAATSGPALLPAAAASLAPAGSQPETVPAVSPAQPTIATGPRETLSTEQIVSRFGRSVALIKSPVGAGTGFVVAPRQLLTNYHVISESPLPQLKVYFPSSDDKGRVTVPMSLLFADPKRDLAILSLDTAEKPLALLPGNSFKAGQSIVVIGNPGVGQDLILENAISMGIMSTKTAIDGQDFFQLSIAINPGNSGGPVFDMTGAVMAVVTLKARRQEGIAFGVPAADVARAVTAGASASALEVSRTTNKHNLVAVCRRVSLMSAVYLNVIEMYVLAMREAGPAQTAATLANAKAGVQSKLNKANAEAMADIEPMVKAFLADPGIPETTRARISEEWAVYLEVKNYADSPRTPVKGYENKLTELTDRRRRAVTALQTALGVENLMEEE